MQVEINYNSSNIKNIKAGDLRLKLSAAEDRVLRYYIDFRHTVLDLHKEVSAPELEILQNKVDTLMDVWDKKFEIYKKKANVTAGKESADDMTVEAEGKRNRLQNILHHTLNIDDAVDWDVLKDHSRFKKTKFKEPRPKNYMKQAEPFMPDIGFFNRILGQRKKIEATFQEKLKAHILREKENSEQRKKKIDIWLTHLAKWDEKQALEQQAFKKTQAITNAQVDALKLAWNEGATEAVLEHASIVLEASDYDDLIPKEFDLQYEAESNTLLIDYLLPSPDDMPTIKTVRFIAGTGELKKTQIAAKDKKALFEVVLQNRTVC